MNPGTSIAWFFSGELDVPDPLFMVEKTLPIGEGPMIQQGHFKTERSLPSSIFQGKC